MARPPKNDVLSQLSKQTPITKVGILFLALALGGVVYWQFFLKDLRAEKQSEESTRMSLSSTQRSLAQRIEALDKLRQQRDALKAEVAGIEFALPADAELNSFLDHVQTKAGDAGVSFKSWGLLGEQKVGKYRKVPLKVVVEGNFYQLMNFFYMLGPAEAKEGDEADPEARKFDRIVTVEDLSLSSKSLRNDEILLTATFNVSTFRQPGAKAPAAPTPTAPGPAGGGNPLPSIKDASGSQAGNAANSMIKDTDAARKAREDSTKKSLDEAGANE